MSEEAVSTDVPADRAMSDRRAYFEQRIFVFSPFGDALTALIVFGLTLGSFFIIAWSEGVVLFAREGAGIWVAKPVRTAFALSVTLGAALFIQRYTRVKERMDYPFFAQSLQPGAVERHNVVSLTPANAQLVIATWLGLFGGALLSWPLYGHYLTGAPPLPGVFAWFAIVTTVLGIAFVRGVELSRTGTQGAHRVISQELLVDLLRIDKLSVWGRSAARFALIWFVVGAVSCLFFLDSGLNILTVGLVVVFLALGIWVFLRTMQPVHEKIRAAKTQELDRVRSEISSLRDAAVSDAGAATRLQGLLAYEARITAAPEWPFDQTTLVRVGASALILTVPWFGQAIAQFAIDHLAH